MHKDDVIKESIDIYKTFIDQLGRDASNVGPGPLLIAATMIAIYKAEKELNQTAQWHT